MTARADAPTRPRRWLRAAVELFLVLGVVLAFRAYQTRDAAGGDAPPFETQTVGGSRASLDGFRGKPVILHFWASWCGVCRAMEGNVRSGESMGVPIVRIATRSGSAEAVRAYLAGQGETLEGRAADRVVMDEDGSIASRYGVRAFPTTFWVGEDGRIEHVEVGYTTSLGLGARALSIRQ